MSEEDPRTHQARHVLLHRNLDELGADYLRHHPNARLSQVTVMQLLEWSFEQTLNPTPTVRT